MPKEEPQTTRRTLTIPEASSVLGISVASGWRRAADGTIRTIRIGGCTRVPVDAIDTLLAGKGAQ
jgi:predicted DNA-binding transcriptional regulator AlpA